MKEYKNMYQLSFGQYIGVLVDERLMKKLTKIQSETAEKIKELLINNLDGVERYSWTIANNENIEGLEEKFDQETRILNFIENADAYQKTVHIRDNLGEMFNVKKIKNLYRLQDADWFENRKLAAQEHAEFLMKQGDDND